MKSTIECVEFIFVFVFCVSLVLHKHDIERQSGVMCSAQADFLVHTMCRTLQLRSNHTERPTTLTATPTIQRCAMDGALLVHRASPVVRLMKMHVKPFVLCSLGTMEKLSRDMRNHCTHPHTHTHTAILAERPGCRTSSYRVFSYRNRLIDSENGVCVCVCVRQARMEIQ